MTGNENFLLYPAPSNETYQAGKVTLILDEGISGTDRLTQSDEFDLQFNFFSKLGTWWQIILEPGAVLYPNEFQLWKVNTQSQNYKMSAFSIGKWADYLRESGTIVSLYWAARHFEMYSAFLEIRNPQGISDKWQIDFSDFMNNIPGELTLNTITDRTAAGACMSVFSITGSDGGSLYTASSGKGRIIYEGLVPDPTGAGGIQTAESSNFTYPPLTSDNSGNFFQNFSLA